MPSININLTDILRTLHCHGDFYATGATEIAAPNLEVEGIGLISLPFQQAQLEQLIACADQAPFGRGTETMIDTTVRRTWQIDARHLHFGGRNWQRSLDAIVASASTGLGVTDPVSAQLYKLLIYDTGSFFVGHRDTEKTPGMFATLVIVLPSVYRGGELLIRHGEREVCLDLACSDPSDAAFVAFYADCVHEVRPVTSGTRLTLIYNLIRSGKADIASPPEYQSEQGLIASLLADWATDLDANADDVPEKLVYPLQHAYSAAELGFSTLKNADAAVAKVLVAAAMQAGCEIHLGQVTIEESGSAEYDYDYQPRRGRYGRYDSEPDDNDFEVGEVFDRSADISEWRRPDGAAVALGALPLLDEELCPLDAFDNEKPDEQQFHEATGNEGASFDRSYRRAALVLWPRRRRLAVMNQAGLVATLPYLEDLVQRGSEGGNSSATASLEEANALASHMVRGWPKAIHSSALYAARMLTCLARLHNIALIDAFLAEVSASGTYDGSENDSLAQAAALLPLPRAADLIKQIIAANATFALSACADLLSKVATASTDIAALLDPAARILVDALLGTYVSPSRPNVWRRPAAVDGPLVVNLLTALQRLNATAMASQALDHMRATFPIDAVLVPAALTLAQQTENRNFAPMEQLRIRILEHLQTRMAQTLEVPQDFARPAAVACQCEHCRELARFLADPARGDWIFKAIQAQRLHVEGSIRHDHCDLDCMTLRRGSPHSLVCTKNQASYEARVKQRAQDQAYAGQLAASFQSAG